MHHCREGFYSVLWSLSNNNIVHYVSDFVYCSLIRDCYHVQVSGRSVLLFYNMVNNNNAGLV